MKVQDRKDIPGKYQLKKSSVAMPVIRQNTTKVKNISGDKRGHFMTQKLAQQKDNNIKLCIHMA